MKHIHNWMNNVASRLMMIAILLIGGIATAQAATTIYIDDFSIKAGETKEIAVNLDTDQNNLYYVSLNISLPDGLTFVGSGKEINLTPNNARIPGFMLAGSKAEGKVFLNSISRDDVIKGSTGSIFTFKVKASSNFSAVEGDCISLRNVTVLNTNDKEVDVNAVSGYIVQPGQIQVSFASNNLVLEPGASITVDVEMSNEDVDVDGFQANLTLPEGWGYSIISSSRMSNVGSANRVLSTNAIIGEGGTLFSIRLTAPAFFTGSASILLEDIIASVDNEDWPLDDIVLNITADESSIPTNYALSFAQDWAAAAPGEEITLDVNLNNAGFNVQGFQANLDIPEGWSYEVVGTERMSNSGSGNLVLNFSGVSGNYGAIFQIKLTAPAGFTTGTATVKVVNALGTVNKQDKLLNDIELTIKAKNPSDLAKVLGWVDGLQEKLDATIARIESEYPAAANDETILREEQLIQQGIVFLHEDVQEAYDRGELNPADFADDVKELSDAIDALEYHAKEIQDNAVNEDNEAGYANLLDELDDLRQMLEDAYAKRPADLPKTAKDAFKDTHDDIDDDIDDLEAAVDAAYAAEELTADIDLDEFAPEEKQAIIDAIKALEAEILTWLRGDVAQNQKVEMPDFYALADSILNENLPTDKEGNAFYRFDANADDEINVGDMQGIVNIVLGMDAYGNASRQAEAVEAKLSVESAKIGNITRYTLNLTGMEYTAFQMDVNGRVAAETADGMTLRTADLKSGARRVLGFGAAKSDGTVLYIDVEGQAQFSNIVFTTGDARTVKFNLGNATGISTVKSAAASGQAYDLGGRAVKNAKGVVIIDGKKVIR